MKMRDIGLAALFLLGFLLTYIEARLMMLVNYYWGGDEMWIREAIPRSLCFTAIFGIFHSIILFKIVFWLEDKWRKVDRKAFYVYFIAAVILCVISLVCGILFWTQGYAWIYPEALSLGGAFFCLKWMKEERKKKEN